MRNFRGLALALLALLPAVAGCGAEGGDEDTLTVLAAASLTESFREIGERFTEQNPEVELRFNFQGSSMLAEQIRQGGAGDVFASANAEMMDKVRQAGAVVRGPETFATNRLTVITPPDDPAGIASFSDLAQPGVSAVVCAPQVPCGSAAEGVERNSGVRLHPVSEEDDVKDVLHKVTSGEADAGLVYVTDAVAAGDQVRRVEIPEGDQVTNEYPIATLEGNGDRSAARRFTDFVRGQQGREILRRHGFGAP
ncbi:MULTISPECIES: molybdate ABC transporter substrate-binding protein [Actinopolyspora]|uniref:Molybdate transport system substrate-binding protein n=1 Tax=Actinopolyspora saharensis TaxID=995062 RepID=A0A1H1EWN1_9ACTN|nr:MULTISPECIES: molybdate ABC transporter substrate-binding protein [Actinopolyspora]NHD18239.1 molybdate ABC transporter substrate-binding protein [Actinopolyspora sp. BKK2]NHE77082.1 molybdate ABC transporter substrate-binding protein [Actinopolyspora sp. BKK1]SDQ92566.1 molybdate transport system substrate-binding protein [Actinopolyspora saharensis]